jgi:hypothetical protein
MLRLEASGPGYPDVLILQNEPIIEKIVARLPGLRSEIYRAVPEESTRHGLGIGSPDLLFIVRGVVLFLELKSREGVVKPEQLDWHAAARARGVMVYVVRLDADTVEGVYRAIEVVKEAIERIRAVVPWNRSSLLLGMGTGDEAWAAVEGVRRG